MSAEEGLSLLLASLRRHAQIDATAAVRLKRLKVQTRVCGAGETIVREGAVPSQCTLLVSGFALRSKVVFGGRRQILSFNVPGEIPDLELAYLSTSDFNLEAVKRTTIASISQDELHKVASEHPDLARAFVIAIAVQSSITREWLANIGSRDARARIAHLLCELAVRLEQAREGDRVGFELPMTQEAISQAMGLSLIHVSRTLRALEEQGLIERERRSVIIKDWGRLKSVGDFNAGYLHASVPSR